MPRVIGGPGARAVIATPAVLMAVGRPLAVTLLVVGLAGLTAIMIWALDRSGPRGARERRDAESWVGVRQAAVSAARDGEQGAAVCEAARGIARADSAQLWELDVTVGEGDRNAWTYRRDPTVRLPWDQAILHTRDGLCYLAPELQLLFKSKDIRPKDDFDAREVIPSLELPRQHRLANLLPEPHPWRHKHLA